MKDNKKRMYKQSQGTIKAREAMYQLDKFEEMDGGINTRKNKEGHKGANHCREQNRKLWRIINVHFIKRHGSEDRMI